MTTHIGIVGTGLSGRIASISCLSRGWQVSLFDADTHSGQRSCGWVGAGMIAPYTELESSDPLVCRMGLDSLNLWPRLLHQLIDPVSFSQNGTLIVNHPQDKGERDRLLTIVDHKLRSSQLPSLDSIADFIPQAHLDHFVPGISRELQDGYWIKGEGHINSHEFYQSTTKTFLTQKVSWTDNVVIEQLTDHQITFNGKRQTFDYVLDCRGLGAKPDWPKLRGIRGELVFLQAPEVQLHCPVRMMHPRYPIYISPRSDHRFVVGATSIESEDKSPISVQSMLELLSACYTLHPGFAQARVIQTMTQCRPTLVDNHPRIHANNGLIRINGLYRHGYMIGPALIEEVMRYIEHGKKAMHYPELISEERA